MVRPDLHSIAEKAEQAERRAEFDAEAEGRHTRIVESGKTIPWSEMRSSLEGCVAGTPAK